MPKSFRRWGATDNMPTQRWSCPWTEKNLVLGFSQLPLETPSLSQDYQLLWSSRTPPSSSVSTFQIHTKSPLPLWVQSQNLLCLHHLSATAPVRRHMFVVLPCAVPAEQSPYWVSQRHLAAFCAAQLIPMLRANLYYHGIALHTGQDVLNLTELLVPLVLRNLTPPLPRLIPYMIVLTLIIYT